MSFLPDNYEPPKINDTGLFMKLQNGDNKVRFLAPPLMGYVYFDNNNKPKRTRQLIANPFDMRTKGDYGPEKVKHFWALTVWDYNAQSVRILEITQSTIMDQIIKLDKNSDWGDPTNYNLTFVKSTEKKGNRDEVKYLVIPSPSANVPPEAIASLQEKPLDLNALYFSGKPNDPDWKTEARNKLYEWVGELYNEAARRNVTPETFDFDSATLSQCLHYYETLLEEVSKAPSVAVVATPAQSATKEEIPF